MLRFSSVVGLIVCMVLILSLQGRGDSQSRPLTSAEMTATLGGQKVCDCEGTDCALCDDLVKLSPTPGCVETETGATPRCGLSVDISTGVWFPVATAGTRGVIENLGMVVCSERYSRRNLGQPMDGMVCRSSSDEFPGACAGDKDKPEMRCRKCDVGEKQDGFKKSYPASACTI